MSSGSPAAMIVPEARSTTEPLPPGVARASVAASRLERRVALVTVIGPFLGVIAAIAMLWGYAIGPGELTILIVMYSLAAVGIGVGYHRLLSHRSFKTSTPLRVLLAILGSISAEGPPLFWVAIHRRHHRHSDQPGDPHSPNMHGEGVLGMLKGFWHAHTGWLFIHETTDWRRWAPDLIRDRAIFRVNQLYFFWIFLGLAVPAVAGGLWARSWTGALLGFLWGGLVRMFLVHHTTWSINSVTHILGTRPYQTTDYSRNNFLIAILTFGEGWHNNHHAFPSSAIHGFEWWQIDINQIVIRTLELFGLVWEVKMPSKEAREKARRHPDLELPVTGEHE
jgi:stearoyl-CoA desaturase (Delta-9 desaturase)